MSASKDINQDVLSSPDSNSLFIGDMEDQEELNLGFLDDSEEEIRSVLIRNSPIIPR